MDVILHLGAHRTGTTTFQHYVRDHLDTLAQGDIGYWGPARTRKSVFPGLFHAVNPRRPQRAQGRVRMLAAKAEARGVRRLLISDENMLGSCIDAFRRAALYPAAGEHMARLAAALGGRVSRVVLTIRAQDMWWASASALTAARGHRVHDAAKYAQIARGARGWRDVITDLACALPGADIRVMPFETFAGRPECTLREALDLDLPGDGRLRWLNRSLPLTELRDVLRERGGDPTVLPRGEGRWQPFTLAQAAALREKYADDLHWLAAGADGLATLTQDEIRARAGSNLPPGHMTEGHTHEQRQVAQHR
ncbi:hypothetical protein BOO69_05160 [Sulfitobacter alexandrii]|uniref:Sulfotransferase family protein n=2 Tax=Sulfitobacter alexandrii TaxID=1917485 RepID=A0A1J0WEY4_9RHOB|nr:hypothetical protein BOO69_05160 [Sulfitobacter alexandrii]